MLTMNCMASPQLRVLIIIISSLISICCGSNYLFGSISVPLSRLLGSDVSLLGSCVDFGVYTGIMISSFYHHFGGRYTATLAASLTCGGYVGLALLVPLKINMAVYGICFFAIGQGSFGIFTICISTLCKTEPLENRGKAVGLLQAAYGFCSLLFANIFIRALGRDVIAFFWMMTAVTGSAALAAFLAIEEPQSDAHEEHGHDAALPPPATGGTTSVELETVTANAASSSAQAIDVPTKPGALRPKLDHVNSYYGHYGPDHMTHESDESLKFLLTSLDFWLILICFFCISGASLMWKNIVGEMIDAMQASGQLVLTTSITDFTSSANQYWSISTALARVGSGILCDLFVQRLPRPIWIFFGSLLLTFSLLPITVFSVVSPGSGDLSAWFWLAAMGNSAAYGCGFAMSTTALSFLYGTRSFSRNYGIFYLSPAAGGLIFTLVGSTTKSATATGIAQFATGLWFAWSLSLVPCVLSVWLTVRYMSHELPLNAHAESSHTASSHT